MYNIQTYLIIYYIGGQLVDYLRGSGSNMPSEQILQIFYQACSAVQHMHQQTPPIVHHDLKVCDN